MTQPLPDHIFKENRNFLQNLHAGEKIYVREDGRLYTPSRLDKIKSIFYKNVESPSQIIKETIVRTFQEENNILVLKGDLKMHQIFLKANLDQLNVCGLLTKDLCNELLNEAYEKRYQAHLCNGKSPFEAECSVSIEMGYDPYFLEDKMVGAYPLGDSEGEQTAPIWFIIEMKKKLLCSNHLMKSFSCRTIQSRRIIQPTLKQEIDTASESKSVLFGKEKSLRVISRMDQQKQ